MTKDFNNSELIQTQNTVNSFALTCAELVLKGNAPFTALYISGPSGSCLSDILTYVETNAGNKKVAHVSLKDKFVMDAFIPLDLEKICTECDILIIHDIDQINTKLYASKNIIAAFEKMRCSNKKIIIPTYMPVSILKKRAVDLAGRIEWEMVVTV